MNDFERKTLAFMVSLSNVYRDEDNQEHVQELELTSDGLTEDFTAMLMAMKLQYERMTEDETDLIGFTHLLNRLAIQHVMREDGKGDLLT